MNNFTKSLLAVQIALVAAVAVAQDEETYATYITEEQWQMVNELPGVDRQIVSRDIGKLLSLLPQMLLRETLPLCLQPVSLEGSLGARRPLRHHLHSLNRLTPESHRHRLACRHRRL